MITGFFKTGKEFNMKKTTMGVVSVALLALGLAAGIVMVPAKTARADGISVVKENFPDDNFRSWVFERFDGTITDDEIKNAKEINISDKGIKDLTGIEYFTEVEKLDCSNNDISKLDLSPFHNLMFLNCDKTQIAELDTNKNAHLLSISCCDIPLKKIDVAGSVALEEICIRSSRLIGIDLSMNTLLDKVIVESDEPEGAVFLPDSYISDLNVPGRWEQMILTKDNWSVSKTEWIKNEENGYNYADITFQYDKNIVNYWVTVRTYASVVSAQAATCEKPGEYNYEAYLPESLSRVGKELTFYNKVEIPATGHDWGDWFLSKEPTVNEEGEETRICRNDSSHKETRKVKKLTPTPTKKPNITLTLDKKTAEIVAGEKLTLKATVKGSKKTVSWKSSNSNIAAVDKNGKITAKKAGKVTITTSCAGVNAKCEVQVLFKDVTNKNDFWYKPAYYLNQKGIVKGYENETEFRPNNYCTRGQIVTFLYRLMGQPKTKTTKCKYQDVKSSDYFYKPVIWATENGITEGYDDKTFKPQNICTRAQVVTFLWRMAGSPEPKSKYCRFPDVMAKDYFYKAAIWAYDKGVLSGYSDGTFRPRAACYRKQMVTFLYKYDKYVNGKG